MGVTLSWICALIISKFHTCISLRSIHGTFVHASSYISICALMYADSPTFTSTAILGNCILEIEIQYCCKMSYVLLNNIIKTHTHFFFYNSIMLMPFQNHLFLLLLFISIHFNNNFSLHYEDLTFSFLLASQCRSVQSLSTVIKK